MPAPFSSHVQQHPLPALYLYPLNDSFIPKHIHLPQGQRIKIGRQTNAKTAPGERNGFFDSKVLSRQHAEVWEDSGKIYIKDVKSSNGTFINGERLSAEGAESEPFELKTGDIVEFGIDIVGEDNKTIVHHKVAARVVCVLTEQEAQLAARVESHQNPPSLTTLSSQPGSSNGTSAFNFTGTQNATGPARRPAIQQQGLVGMGGMGANMRAPGKSGITFDHILSRLQGELQKSRETGAELHSLTTAMNEIHETLGGNLPQTLPSYPQTLPPVLPPQQPLPTEADPNPSSSATNSALSELQAQLQETQVSLASHVDKIRSLDNLLAEHEVIKREVTSLRELLEEEKRELEQVRGGRRWSEPRRQHTEEEDGDLQSDDDDAHSIATVTAHELERVEEEDEEQLGVEEEEQRHRRDELTRPRTPEPTGLGMDDEEDKTRSRSRSPSPSPPTVSQSVPYPSEDINSRLVVLSSQLESALELSRTLQAQHAAAQNTISSLEAKVNALESLVQTSQAQAQSHAAEATQERASLTALVNEWKRGVEGQWGGVQEEWAHERARLARARDEWELRMHAVEKGLEGTIAKVDAGLSALEQQRLPFQHKQNGSARGGLVTPPSPRSLSSDSGSGGKSRRKKRSAASRGRSRSKDGSTSSSEAANADGDGGSSSASVAAGGLPPNPNPRPRSPWLPEGDSDSDSHLPGRLDGHRRIENLEKKAPPPISYPITPDSSVRKVSSGSSLGLMSEEDAEQVHKASLNAGSLDPHVRYAHYTQTQVMSTAAGVLVLAAAAVAVAWRVKE
ncbi:hypothetical protein B0F90DRAFT_1668384 [Multifurca ochricompacta]|uniref:FHA domain-containing protein n=1 Tax=Multifurca ochricompacta TaxID=376703 RepID=A0AAD4M4W0_9AGAM|nr:hypothetical protein B0F90DRAFT_1668384 [Multifurca ochricompacta]